jgi:hypothetical protein
LIHSNIDNLEIYDEGPHDQLPTNYSLELINYPNPFNPSTTIRFSVESRHATSLRVYDITGRLVETLVDSKLQAGEYEVVWNASNQPSGVYLVRMTTPKSVHTQKVLLMK